MMVKVMVVPLVLIIIELNASLRWGLLPSWTKAGPDGGPPAKGPQLINARAETVAEKASFRGAWRHRRCLLPADAFLEKGRRIQRCDGAPFWLAGLWERWMPAPIRPMRMGLPLAARCWSLL